MITDVVCPRCDKPAKYLVLPYWSSPFAEYGGLCSVCCEAADELYQRVGWPPMADDKDWSKLPTNCPCGGSEEFCEVCEGTGVAWTNQ